MKKIGLIFLIILLSQAAFVAENTGFYLGVFDGFAINELIKTIPFIVTLQRVLVYPW